LYEAGRIAEKEEASTITEEHVANAVQQAEINRFKQLVSGTTPHVKHILRTLAILTADNPGQQSFSTSEIYEAYTKLVATEGATPLSEDRVYRLLKEQSFLGVTESEHTGGGHGKGRVANRVCSGSDPVSMAVATALRHETQMRKVRLAREPERPTCQLTYFRRID